MSAPPPREMPWGASWRPLAAALLALALGLGATFAVVWRLTAAANARDGLRLENSVIVAESLIRRRLDRYAGLVSAASGLFSVQGDLSSAELRAYMARLNLAAEFPGLHALGFARRVPAAAPEAAPEPLVVSLLEPADSDAAVVLGDHLEGQPVHREAMARARDNGRPAATSAMEAPSRNGRGTVQVFVYVPVYRGSGVPDTLDERRASLRGFVFASLRADQMLARPEYAAVYDVDFHIYDGGVVSSSTLLMSGGSSARPPGLGETVVRHLPFAGRTWTVVYAPRPEFVQGASGRMVPIVGASGLTISLLLFGLVVAQVRARGRAEADARRLREARLAVEAHLAREEDARRGAEGLVRLGRAVAAELDLDKLLGVVVDEATGLLRAEFGAFVHAARDGARRCVIAGQPPLPREWLQTHVPSGRLGRGTTPGDGVLLSNDLTRDPRFTSAPASERKGDRLPALPGVRSYLAVAVTSRAGEALGWLFFGHRVPNVFGDSEARLSAAVAAQAAIAVENARLFQRVQDAVRARDSFLAIASHELKTPLTALQLHVDGLLRLSGRGRVSANDGERLHRRLEGVSRQSRRLAGLVNELLDVAQVTHGQLTLVPQEVHLGERLERLRTRLQPDLERSGCRLNIVGDTDIRGQWDGARLEQVLANLLVNAFKYAPGRPVEVIVTATPDEVYLSVVDHGIGIDLKDQTRIFERFERAVSERHYGGFGLGLWIAREIVEAMGGTITLRSRPGEGATFEVCLPRRPGVETKGHLRLAGAGPQ